MTCEELRRLMAASRTPERYRLRERELCGDVGTPSPRVAIPVCVHLGRADPNQHKVPCGRKVRDCAMLGSCTVTPCSKGTLPHCLGADGRPACVEYEAAGHQG